MTRTSTATAAKTDPKPVTTAQVEELQFEEVKLFSTALIQGSCATPPRG